MWQVEANLSWVQNSTQHAASQVSDPVCTIPQNCATFASLAVNLILMDAVRSVCGDVRRWSLATAVTRETLQTKSKCKRPRKRSRLCKKVEDGKRQYSEDSGSRFLAYRRRISNPTLLHITWHFLFLRTL